MHSLMAAAAAGTDQPAAQAAKSKPPHTQNFGHAPTFSLSPFAFVLRPLSSSLCPLAYLSPFLFPLLCPLPSALCPYQAANLRYTSSVSEVHMHAFLQDVRYAIRTLSRSAGLTLVIVASLAIGIGANTAIFSVVNALLLKPLPYPEPDRLAVLWLRSPGINIPQDWPSPGQYIDVQTENRSFEEMSISQGRSGTLLGLEQPQRVEALLTSSSLFQLLGAQPLHGRLLLPEEDGPASRRS